MKSGLGRVSVAILKVEVRRAIETQYGPSNGRIYRPRSVCEQRTEEQDRSVRVAGLVQDVPGTEFTHPVLRVERPAGSGIADRVDRETLVVLFVPNDCLHDWSGLVRRILVPFDALGGRA